VLHDGFGGGDEFGLGDQAHVGQAAGSGQRRAGEAELPCGTPGRLGQDTVGTLYSYGLGHARLAFCGKCSIESFPEKSPTWGVLLTEPLHGRQPGVGQPAGRVSGHGVLPVTLGG
jgi:hypothetical protein